jgi:hypothetical protein
MKMHGVNDEIVNPLRKKILTEDELEAKRHYDSPEEVEKKEEDARKLKEILKQKFKEMNKKK